LGESRPGLREITETCKWQEGLFIKNTGLCKFVKRTIGSEACPVPNREHEI